jgi:hypothetical protein
MAASPTPAQIRRAIASFLAKHGRYGGETPYVVTSASAMYLYGGLGRTTIADIDILADVGATPVSEVCEGLEVDAKSTCQGLEEHMYRVHNVRDGIHVARLDDVLRLKLIIRTFNARRQKWEQDDRDIDALRARIRFLLSDGTTFERRVVSPAEHAELSRL